MKLEKPSSRNVLTFATILLQNKSFHKTHQQHRALIFLLAISTILTHSVFQTNKLPF